MIPAKILKKINRLSDAVVVAANKEIPNSTRYEVIWATVESIQSGPPVTVTLYIAGSGVTNAGIRCLSSYVPRVGDYVRCERFGKDLTVIGTLTGGGSSSKLRVTIPYPVPGLIEVPVGGTNYLPPFNVAVPSGQTVTLREINIYTRVGSCTVDIYHNGSAITGLTGLTVTSTPTVFTPSSPVSCSNQDSFQIVVTAI